MATRMVTTCDRCGSEISSHPVYLSAWKWTPAGPGAGGGCIVDREMGMKEFCGEGCAIGAVAELIRGQA